MSLSKAEDRALSVTFKLSCYDSQRGNFSYDKRTIKKKKLCAYFAESSLLCASVRFYVMTFLTSGLEWLTKWMDSWQRIVKGHGWVLFLPYIRLSRNMSKYMLSIAIFKKFKHVHVTLHWRAVVIFSEFFMVPLLELRNIKYVLLFFLKFVFIWTSPFSDVTVYRHVYFVGYN